MADGLVPSLIINDFTTTTPLLSRFFNVLAYFMWFHHTCSFSFMAIFRGIMAIYGFRINSTK